MEREGLQDVPETFAKLSVVSLRWGGVNVNIKERKLIGQVGFNAANQVSPVFSAS
jgi:hypothetical protein